MKNQVEQKEPIFSRETSSSVLQVTIENTAALALDPFLLFTNLTRREMIRLKKGGCMVYDKRRIIAGVALLFLCVTGAAYGDDLDDVKAIFNEDMRLFNAQNTAAFATNAHADVVLFGMLSPFAVRGKAAITDMLEGFFADIERILFTPVNPEFSITGASALAWGHFTNTEVPAVGPREVIHGRYTFTYAKRDGKWLLVGLHFSPLGVEE